LVVTSSFAIVVIVPTSSVTSMLLRRGWRDIRRNAGLWAGAPDALSTLTPQERRVAEAVATGASDRQVAAELFLSPRTVAYHLSSVYRKLGISSRAALAARLASGRSHAARDSQAGPG
jgi:DNA-binding NarL/FixJ family response regulator